MLGNALAYKRTDERIVQFVFRLRFELRVYEFYGNHRRDAFAHVLAGKLVRFFHQPRFLAVIVDYFGQRKAQALYVRAAVDGIYVIRVRIYHFVVRFVVLNRHFAHRIAVRLFEIQGLREQQLFAGSVQIFHERTDAAFVAERIFLFLPRALIFQRNAKPLVQIRQLAQTDFQRVVHKIGGFENFFIGKKSYFRASFLGIAHHLHAALRHAAVVHLLVNVPVLIYFRFQPFRKRVHRLYAYAVQAARYLIPGIPAELAARVHFGEYYFQRGNSLFRVNIHGDAAPVVAHGAAAVGIDGYFDVRAVSRQRLVDRVIHNLVHKVVQPFRIGGGNIHAGAFSDVFQAVENLYLFRAVLVFYFFRHCRLFLLVIVFSLMFCFVTISPACALVCVCARRILYADKLIITYPPEKVQRFSAINPICGKIFLFTKKA